jgi:hypothetical protein
MMMYYNCADPGDGRRATAAAITWRTGVSPKHLRRTIRDCDLAACDLGTRWFRIRGSDFSRWGSTPPRPEYQRCRPRQQLPSRLVAR